VTDRCEISHFCDHQREIDLPFHMLVLSVLTCCFHFLAVIKIQSTMHGDSN